MFRLTFACITVFLAAASSALAQKWEFGAVGGASIYKTQSVTNGTVSGDAGFQNGVAVGAVIGNDLYKHLGGEIRYLYEKNSAQIKGSGASATFGSESHAAHYDLLVYATPRGSRVRPFGSFGFGMKLYRGTGLETAYYPGNNLVLFTKGTEWKPVVAAGGGVKIRAGKHVSLRAEFRTYMSPFPTKIIAPSRGVKIDSWVFNFVPLFGLTFVD